MLSWVGETEVPPKTVLCTPSKNTEAWVMAVFFPLDSEMKKKGWECHPTPGTRLGQKPKKDRFSKSRGDYEQRKAQISSAWPTLTLKLSEASRFRDDFQVGLRQVESTVQ
jgi:hypothetical protein